MMKLRSFHLAFVALAFFASSCSVSHVKESQSVGELLDSQGSPAERQYRMRRTAENEIVLCMREKGFQYVAFIAPMSTLGTVGPAPGGEIPWKRLHAYGISDSIVAARTRQSFLNPNELLRAKLSKEAAIDYEKAYSGIDLTRTRTGRPSGGCAPRAYLGVGSSRQIARESLRQKYVKLEQTIDAYPAVLQATRRWKTCMNMAGYTVTDQKFIVTMVLQKAESEIFAISQNNLTPGLPENDPVKFEAFKRIEFDIAEADADCSELSSLDKNRNRVRAALEQEFLNSNLELLKTAEVVR